MNTPKFSIELFLKEDGDDELGEVEFSRAIKLPTQVLTQEHQLMSLRYKDSEKEIADHHVLQLNLEIQKVGYKNVEFRIREINRG